MIIHEVLSLGMLVPNSRDQHETNGDQILHTTKRALQCALFEKSRLKYASNTINNIALLRQSKNPNSLLTCRGFLRFCNPAIFRLPASLP